VAIECKSTSKLQEVGRTLGRPLTRLADVTTSCLREAGAFYAQSSLYTLPSFISSGVHRDTSLEGALLSLSCMHTRLCCATKHRLLPGYCYSLRARSFSPSNRSGVLHITSRSSHTHKLVPLVGAGRVRISFSDREDKEQPSTWRSAKRNVSVMATATSGGDDDYKSKSQQSPLASQRAKEGGQEKRAGRFTGYFPLGYKEGFSQWVGRHLEFPLRKERKWSLIAVVVGKYTSGRRRAQRPFICPIPSKTSHAYSNGRKHHHT